MFGAGVPAILLPGAIGDSKTSVTDGKSRARFADGWSNPPLEFSQAPFWFWNDRLSEEEIIRQLDDFWAHGVYGFVIHPRAGLPRSIGWMSDSMIRFMRIAIEQAAKRDMWVVLYDEGMYPSGSSSGQVVAERSAFGGDCQTQDERPPDCCDRQGDAAGQVRHSRTALCRG
ncbi:MAG: hypothetical protein ACYSYM_11595 [Planctomycetota bacterium]